MSLVIWGLKRKIFYQRGDHIGPKKWRIEAKTGPFLELLLIIAVGCRGPTPKGNQKANKIGVT